MSASPAIPIGTSTARPARPAASPEAVEALAGLAVAALSHAVAAVVSRRYSADPARILPALRITPEEMVFVAPLVGLLLSRMPRKAQAWLALGVLAIWFGSRVWLAAQAGRLAREAAAPAREPAPPSLWRRIVAKIWNVWR
jgi:hypothetical protein